MLVRGIIDTAPAPLLTELTVSYTSPTALDNPYSGAGALTGYFGVGSIPYALIWTTYTSPTNAGGASRAVSTFELPFLSLCPSYPLIASSQWLVDHVVTHDASGILWFSGGPPASVQYSILDGWQVNFQWVVAP